MRTRMYGGVRGRKTKVGRKLTLFSSYSIMCILLYTQLLTSWGTKPAEQPLG